MCRSIRRIRPERLAYMLEDARVPLVLAQPALRARLPATGAEVLCLDGDAGRRCGGADEGDLEDAGRAGAASPT